MIFLDTSAWIAIYSKKDKFHRRANRFWLRLTEPIFTSDQVIAELAEWILYETEPSPNYEDSRQAVGLVVGSNVDILQLTRDARLHAVEIYEREASRGVSWVDCTSFALMRGRGIRRAFTFDKHFEAGGFQVVPEPSKKA